MSAQIKFSVIMPAYNRAFCISKAVDSLLAQTYAAWELIIIDDGSTDGTEALIKQKYAAYLKNKQIRYIKAPHQGVSAARNIGLAKAKFTWIAYLDTDNTWYPDFLATYVAAIKAHPRYKIFYAEAQASDRIIGRAFDRQALEMANYIDLGTLVHHKSLSKKYGNFNTALQRLVDWDLILRYTQEITPLFIEQIVMNYNDSNAFARISNTEKFAENQQIIRQRSNFQNKEGYLFMLKLAKMLHLISAQKYKFLRAVKMLKKSPLFDGKWYLRTYTDVAAAHMEPERHYLKYGWKEGRQPSLRFDGKAYLAENPDVVAAGICPLEHYLFYGIKEGRSYSAVKGGIETAEMKATIGEKIRAILTYPVRIHEEYERLRTEINILQNTK